MHLSIRRQTLQLLGVALLAATFVGSAGAAALAPSFEGKDRLKLDGHGSRGERLDLGLALHDAGGFTLNLAEGSWRGDVVGSGRDRKLEPDAATVARLEAVLRASVEALANSHPKRDAKRRRLGVALSEADDARDAADEALRAERLRHFLLPNEIGPGDDPRLVYERSFERIEKRTRQLAAAEAALDALDAKLDRLRARPPHVTVDGVEVEKIRARVRLDGKRKRGRLDIRVRFAAEIDGERIEGIRRFRGGGGVVVEESP